MRIDRRGLIGGGAALAASLPLRALATDKVFLNRILVEDGRVWIAAKIGDKGPFFFIVDTGGYMSLIDDAFAKSMGFHKMAGRQGVGIGGVSDYSWYNAGTVTLASGIRFPNMLFAGMRERPAKDAVGTFGAGLFTSYDSDLDFAKGEWRAYPDGRPNFDGMEKLKSRFTDPRGGERIIADATLDGFEGDFLLDTGAPGQVSLYGRASAKSGLWNATQPYAPYHASGVGKARVPGRIVRAKQLRIGSFAFDNPMVRLSEPGTPTGQNDGIIGLQMLSRLHLSTDVSQKVVWASRNDAPAPRPSYQLSGLWLDEEGGRVTIADVGTGSPAAMAGLKKGDVVIGEIRALIALTNGPPRKPVTLTIERGGKRQDVSYTLAPWL